MANVCDYGMSIAGPAPVILTLNQFLLPVMEYVCGPWGTIILDLSKLYGDLTDSDHRWIGVQEWRFEESHYENVAALIELAGRLGFGDEVKSRWTPDNGQLSALLISGEAKWGPPVRLAERLSAKFTDLGFRVSGTTEHEHYDDWVVFGGHAHPIGERSRG